MPVHPVAIGFLVLSQIEVNISASYVLLHELNCQIIQVTSNLFTSPMPHTLCSNKFRYKSRTDFS